MPMDIQETFGMWLGVAAIALSFMTMLLGTVYLFGAMLMNDKIKGWARMELAEVFYSAVLLVLAAMLINTGLVSSVLDGAMGIGSTTQTSVWIPVKNPALFGLADSAGEYGPIDICYKGGPGDPMDVSTWADSAYYGVTDCHMRLAIYYMDTLFHETGDYAFSVYSDYLITSTMAEFTINIEYLFDMAGFFTFNPWKGFFTVENTIKSICFDYAMKILMLIQFQEAFIRFIAVALFPVMFVSGAILRTLTFTRRLGGLLIGLALSLYFVFPAFYAFGGLVIIDMKNNPDVVSEWVASPMNPGNRLGHAPTLNPPIANSLYLVGEAPMIGGSFDNDDAWADYARMRGGMTSEQFLEAVERGELEGERIVPGGYDLTPDVRAATPEEEEARLERLAEVRSRVDNWFDTVSNTNFIRSKLDVQMDFDTNGIIDMLSRLTFFSGFFALFSVLGTIAAARSLSVTFGGDMEIAGLTRLI